VLEPDPESKELTVVSIHPGVTRECVQEATGWPLRFAARVSETAAPSETELSTLRKLLERTAEVHGTAGTSEA
jgi:glutaconate CoA-transferase, subunit B